MTKELTVEEFYRFLDMTSGKELKDTLKVSTRQDPVVELNRPLRTYEDRLFFYVGLLYGFCRLDASITERFRESSGMDLDTQLHVLPGPIVTVKGFPDFTKTRVSRLLQSCPRANHEWLMDYIASQVVVDRARQRVWKIQMTTCRIPDPYSGSLASGYDVVMFYPQTHSFEYRPFPSAGMLLSPPEVRCCDRVDADFEASTKRYLGKE